MKPQKLEDFAAAEKRLWTIANGHSGQCRTTAAFLLGLYNGYRFPFDLTDFRSLDRNIFADCLTVLTSDYAPQTEIHNRLGVSGEAFEQLAKDWNINDRSEDGEAL